MKDRLIAAAREYLAGAGRAIDRDDAASASRELVLALQNCIQIVRAASDADPERYREAWADVAQELARLPPSLLRKALRILDGDT